MRAGIIIVFLVAIILLSFTTLSQNLPMIYADKPKNRSLINDISKQVVDLGINKNLLQQVLQQVQTQIALTSGQEKATNAIKQLNSVIELNPNGPLSQSLLFLAKQQGAGNTAVVNQAAIEVARFVSSGSDNIVVGLEQAVTSLKTPSLTQVRVTTTQPSTTPNADQKQLQQPIEKTQQTIITLYNNTPSNHNTANTGHSNSNPHSSIKVTSVDQDVPPSPSYIVSTSAPPSASQQQQQLQQEIQQILTQSGYVPSTSNSNPQTDIGHTSVLQPSSAPTRPTSQSQTDTSQATNFGYGHKSVHNLVVNADSPITLDGSASYDPDGNPITFAWTQEGGPSVMLSHANMSQATFTAPNLNIDTTMLFKLTVTDVNGLSDSGIVQITVIHNTQSPTSSGSSIN